MRLQGRKLIANTIAIAASSVRTIPSVKELHLVGTQCVLADYTAGEDLHLALKQIYVTPMHYRCQVSKAENMRIITVWNISIKHRIYKIKHKSQAKTIATRERTQRYQSLLKTKKWSEQDVFI